VPESLVLLQEVVAEKILTALEYPEDAFLRGQCFEALSEALTKARNRAV
jgi:hypothetical protein